MDLKKFAEELVNMSAKEVQELAETLKEEYGLVISKVELLDGKQDVMFLKEPKRYQKNREVQEAQNMRYKQQKGAYSKGYVNRYNVKKNRRG